MIPEINDLKSKRMDTVIIISTSLGNNHYINMATYDGMRF